MCTALCESLHGIKLLTLKSQNISVPENKVDAALSFVTVLLKSHRIIFCHVLWIKVLTNSSSSQGMEVDPVSWWGVLRLLYRTANGLSGGFHLSALLGSCSSTVLLPVPRTLPWHNPGLLVQIPQAGE